MNHRIGRLPGSDVAGRFWLKVDKRHSDACWNWTAAHDRHGYGVLNVNGKVYRAHRLSWTLHNGDIPKGEGYHGVCVCHTCNNSSCVNPDHLYLGSHQTNHADAQQDGLLGPIDPVKGEAHHHAKLSPGAVRFIRANRPHMKLRKLADKYGVSLSAISDVLAGRTWSHID